MTNSDPFPALEPIAFPAQPPFDIHDQSFPVPGFTVGAGVVIFHLATSRVLLVHHIQRPQKWFIPRGRRDVGEEALCGAEREGFEESGVRCRVLPIPSPSTQGPKNWGQPHGDRRLPFQGDKTEYEELPDEYENLGFVTEPILATLYRLRDVHPYWASWYVAETLPEDVQILMDRRMERRIELLSQKGTRARCDIYESPPPVVKGMTLRERMAQDREGYEPPRIRGTWVTANEEGFESEFMDIQTALRRTKGTLVETILRAAWESVRRRWEMEERAGAVGKTVKIEDED